MKDLARKDSPLRIGTRGSDLALWQAREVARRLEVPSEIVIIKTEGDRRLDIALQGGTVTGFFTKDIERRLLEGEVDLAVHSLKDLPTVQEAALEIAAILPRAPVADLLLIHPDWFEEREGLPLRPGCRVGAGSLRRQALVRLYRSDANPELIRGNVPTRARKCESCEYGAVVLARAGVERLGLALDPLRVFELDPERWLPAPGQGAVAVEIRADDQEARAAAAAIDDRKTAQAVRLERQLLANFEGGCHTAFGAHATRLDEGWDVLLGIDRGEAGWGQARFTGSFEECAALDRAVLGRLEPPPAGSEGELCRPFLRSS